MNIVSIAALFLFLTLQPLFGQATITHKILVFTPTNPARSVSGLITVSPDKHGLSSKQVIVAVKDITTDTLLDANSYKYSVDPATYVVKILLPASTANHTVAVNINGLPDEGMKPTNRSDDLLVAVDQVGHRIILSPAARENRQEFLTYHGHSYHFYHPQQLPYDPTLTGVVRFWLQDEHYYAGISTSWGETKPTSFFVLVNGVNDYPSDAGYKLGKYTFQNGALAPSGHSDDRKKNY